MHDRGTTLVAPVTGTGRAAVAILRVSGPATFELVAALAKDPVEPGRARLRTLRDPRNGERIDNAIVLCFRAPRSFTGEDVVEFHHHGGQAVRRALLDVLLARDGVELAGPGDFSRRAFLNGRLDLDQAEAIADLVDAGTAAQRRQALRGLSGERGARLERWRSAILEARALLEAEIDFAPEEGDVADDSAARLQDGLAAVRGEIRAELSDRGVGERLREGLVVAVVGAPNVGKSSLVNRLAAREVAIVTEQAGTTRDTIEVQLDLAGWPVTLIDTAGLRDSADPVERIGIDRARRAAESADLRLRLVDDPALATSHADDAELLVCNKIDLHRGRSIVPAALPISCATGEGIADLIRALRARADALMVGGEEAVITTARHRSALQRALDALDRSVDAPEIGLAAEDLRLAADAIGELTGRIVSDDILDRIFARFCIGK